jgi:hypothetical protein
VLDENSPAAGHAARADDRVCADEARSDTTIAPNAATRSLRRQRHVARICRLGDRVVHEFIDHLARTCCIEDDVDRLLERYAGIDLDANRGPPPRVLRRAAQILLRPPS